MKKEQARRIVDQLDIIEHLKCKYNALDTLMAAAVHDGENCFDGADITNIGWLLKDAILDPIFEAAENIYQIIKEDKESD